MLIFNVGIRSQYSDLLLMLRPFSPDLVIFSDYRGERERERERERRERERERERERGEREREREREIHKAKSWFELILMTKREFILIF